VSDQVSHTYGTWAYCFNSFTKSAQVWGSVKHFVMYRVLRSAVLTQHPKSEDG
jgi:hypothetical protein